MSSTTEIDLSDLPTNVHVPLPEGVIARVVMRRDGGVHTVDSIDGAAEVIRRETGEVAVVLIRER